MSEREEQQAERAIESPESAGVSDFARLLDQKIGIGEGGVEIKTMEDLGRLATWIHRSGLAPKGDTVPGVAIKIQAGAELGFSPMRALSVLTSVNGRIGIMGDAAKALVRARGALKPGTDFEERIEGEGDNRVAVVSSWRRGTDKPRVDRFGVRDAKLARLWNKSGPWSDYPDRMLKYRALGFHLRDLYSDVLMGMYTAEELHDFPAEATNGRTAAEAPKPPAEPDPLLASQSPAPSEAAGADLEGEARDLFADLSPEEAERHAKTGSVDRARR